MVVAVDTALLAEEFEALKMAAESALGNESVEEFEEVEQEVNRFEAHARELQQEMWAGEVKNAIRRLEKSEPLTPQDHDVVRTFLVSDAEHYLAQENNFPDWITEFRRLMKDIAKRINTLDRTTIGALRGVIKDAVRLAPDIRNYLDEQRRVERFREAAGNLDASSRKMLVHLLREQLRTSNR